MQYEEGKIYEIITPSYGALFYKYQNSYFCSVDRNGNELSVLKYGIAGDGTPTAGTREQYRISLNTLKQSNYIIGAVDDCEIWKSFTSKTIGEGIMLNIDPKSSQYSSSIMQALTEDSASLLLYTCAQAIMPYMITVATATKCLSSTQISFDMISMRHSQSVLHKQVAMEKMIEEIRNSKLMKFLSSPWFIFTLVIAAVVIAALCIFTGGLAAAAIIPAISVTIIAVSLAVAVAAALITVVSVKYAQDKASMDKLMKELGYSNVGDMPKEIKEMYDEIQKAIDVAFALAVVMIVISAVSMGYGGAAINTTVAQVAQNLAQSFMNSVVTKGIMNAAIILTVVGVGVSVATAIVSFVSGINAIVEGLIMMGVAAMEHAINTVRAQVDGLSAMSKFFKDLLARMAQSLKLLMDTIQSLIKAQGDIIKTLGDGSRTVTRNIAGI